MSQNTSARYQKNNNVKSHNNQLSSSTVNTGANLDPAGVGSRPKRSTGMTPNLTVNRERDFDQSDPRNAFAKADTYARRDKYNETSMSQL